MSMGASLARGLWLAAAMAALFGCGSSSTTADPTGAGGTGGSTGAGAAGGEGAGGPAEPVCEDPVGSCNTVVCAQPLRNAAHQEPCSDISFHTNPPTSGAHYGVWASYKTYSEPLPRGFYLHSMEHSGILLAYSCALFSGDCTALAAELDQFRQDYGRDDLCTVDVHNRIVVTPDPLLDVPFAAAAWGHSLTGDCFDAQLVQEFSDAHYGMNYENFCSDGVDPTDPAAGYPTDCGQ
jgi:hypothetical protein